MINFSLMFTVPRDPRGLSTQLEIVNKYKMYYTIEFPSLVLFLESSMGSLDSVVVWFNFIKRQFLVRYQSTKEQRAIVITFFRKLGTFKVQTVSIKGTSCDLNVLNVTTLLLNSLPAGN